MQTHLHSIVIVVVLFFFGLISPGPNFLVVAQTALKFGRVAGLVTGLGAALGDGVYASIGLFGVTQLIVVRPVMMGIELLGGLYLTWLGARMLTHSGVGTQFRSSLSSEGVPVRSHFWRGLTTDLANPKTVVFFAGIFAITVSPATTGTIRGAMLLGIVVTSVLWRLFVSVVFSTTFIRTLYERTERIVERVSGAALCFFGLLLVKRVAS
jgi:amino acid exporter